MRPKISYKNIKYFLRQEYGLKSVDDLFKYKRHTAMEKAILKKVVFEFTGYQFKNGKLLAYNPYTNSYESLHISSLEHIQSKEELLKELAMLHKTRMVMLEKSRKQIIALSKAKDRDKDLEATIVKQSQRTQELQQLQKARGKHHGMER